MSRTPYQPDLAAVHDDGFVRLAEGGADFLIDALQRRGVDSGTVVDLGCGSGVTARRLVDAGYDVFGIDLSSSMIERARQRVPEAEFLVGSFVDATLPACVAVTAIGEIVNYLFDERNTDAARLALFDRIAQALAAGGLFLFDVAGPSRAPQQTTQRFFQTDDWCVLVEASAEGDLLTRQITTYVRDGAHYRKDAETHRLRLLDPAQIIEDLRIRGFHVEEVEAYADVPMLLGLHGFSAIKNG